MASGGTLAVSAGGSRVCYGLAVTLEQVASAAAELLDAADERLVAADLETVSYDHAAAEARLVVAGCLETASEAPDAALLILEITLQILTVLPLPTRQDELRLALRAELRRQGHAPPPFLQAVS
jgi:hypothetical protein